MNILLTDYQSDIVFFSKFIKEYQCWPSLSESLIKENIKYAFLPSTKDIWVRDFMPLQIYENLFIQYKYCPNYLINEKEYLTQPENCYASIQNKIIPCELILDGGNIIKCNHCIIMTEKIFYENKQLNKTQVLSLIEKLFECEIIVIPWDKADIYGHADGMVRFIKDDVVLMNNYIDHDKAFRNKLKKALSNRFVVEELHYETNKKYNWYYINFMQLGEKLFIPSFGTNEDEKATQLLQNLYKGVIQHVNARTLAKRGGALNCISWTVKKDKTINILFNSLLNN